MGHIEAYTHSGQGGGNDGTSVVDFFMWFLCQVPLNTFIRVMGLSTGKGLCLLCMK